MADTLRSGVAPQFGKPASDYFDNHASPSAAGEYLMKTFEERVA